MQLPISYYQELAQSYQQKRDILLAILDQVGIPYYKPRGAYYVLANVSAAGYANDLAFAHYLVTEIGVAVVPGSSFLRQNLQHLQPKSGREQWIRFCFSKRTETLVAAAERLGQLGKLLGQKP
jgi:aminotransferase